MSRQSQGDEYEFTCPLCGHQQEMTAREETMCPYCSAELHIFHVYDTANQFAETRKAAKETAKIQPATNGEYWVVGHKWTPPGHQHEAA